MKHSVYITWAKRQAAARYNLANSGILGCDLNDLPITTDDVALNCNNGEGYGPLKEAIAAKYGVGSADKVVTEQGTSMANFLAMATAIERGDEVLVEQPTYDPLLCALEYLGADVKRFARGFENGYRIDVDEVRRLITPRTRWIVITSPHNPSGVVVDPATIKEIGEIARHAGARVLADEVYRDILFENAPPVAASLGPQFITTGSLTIVDDDAFPDPSLRVAAVSASEGDTPAVKANVRVPIRLSAPLAGDVVVTWDVGGAGTTAAAGVDYQAITHPRQTRIRAGRTSAIATITLYGDTTA